MPGEATTRDETESRSQITQSRATVEICKIGRYIELLESSTLHKAWFIWNKIIVVLQGTSGSSIRLILSLIAVSMDPLFFYIPTVNDNKKCIKLDYKLATTAIVLRSLFDFLYILYISPQLLADLVATVYAKREGNNSLKSLMKILSRSFFVDLPAVFPLPQLVILSIIPRMRSLEILNAMILLKYSVLIQFVPRIIRIYPWTLRKLTDATWAPAAFNVFLYTLASHVFGALWYFSAIERQTECWKKAFLFKTGCSSGSFDCDDSLGNYEVLNEFCLSKNTTVLDFGIFQHALQSGIVEAPDFSQKFLHCFRWGLRNLSCFGQNMQTSSDIWENFFVILVTITGLLLLLFLVGNMQIYLQPTAGRPKEMSVRMQEMNERMPIEKLSQSVQQQLKMYQQYIWRKPDTIDVESSLSILPKELRRNIKRELCLDLLKNVKEFKKLDEAILDALCDCVKLTFYFKHTHIILEGDPIYEMLFVVQGKIWIFSSKERINGPTNTDRSRDNNNNTSKKDHLADGDFWGEELVTWTMHDCSLSNIPISTRTVQTLTDVEAFALTAEDLKNVLHWVSSSTKLNVKHSTTQAARVIQLAWRSHHIRRKSTQ